MKAFLALTFLTALSLAAGDDFKNLKPHDIVMPVNPRHTAQEWQDIYAAQVPSPEYNPSYKKGIEPQPVYAGNINVPLNEQANRITGVCTAPPSRFPYFAALIIDGAWFCGGSLISSLLVLTAAHCAGRSYQIILGSNRYVDLETGSPMLSSSNSIVHPDYNPNTINNDIALVRLPVPVATTTFISPIRLRYIAGDLAGASVHANGWGRTSNNFIISRSLYLVDLTVITNAQCAAIYGSIITPSKICCVTSCGQNICDSYSGGPLIYRENDGVYTQIGILSFVAVAGCQLPVGFTRVTSYLSWISSNTGIITN